MKNIILLLLGLTISTTSFALNKNNSIYVGNGGPFYHTQAFFSFYSYGYTRELTNRFSVGINFSSYPGNPILSNYSLYIYNNHVPMGEFIDVSYIQITYGEVTYDMSLNPVNGLVLGVASKSIHEYWMFDFGAHYLVALEPGYIFSGYKVKASASIGLRF